MDIYLIYGSDKTNRKTLVISLFLVLSVIAVLCTMYNDDDNNNNNRELILFCRGA